jgi:hypothetical protein
MSEYKRWQTKNFQCSYTLTKAIAIAIAIATKQMNRYGVPSATLKANSSPLGHHIRQKFFIGVKKQS